MTIQSISYGGKWEISWTEEPGRLQSIGAQRVGHDLATEHARLAPPSIVPLCPPLSTARGLTPRS